MTEIDTLTQLEHDVRAHRLLSESLKTMAELFMSGARALETHLAQLEADVVNSTRVANKELGRILSRHKVPPMTIALILEDLNSPLDEEREQDATA